MPNDEIDLQHIVLTLFIHPSLANLLVTGSDGSSNKIMETCLLVSRSCNRQILEGFIILSLEILFGMNLNEVARCRSSPHASKRAKNLAIKGNRVCTGAPWFFKQCYCDDPSDLSRYLQPKRGCGLIHAAKPIIRQGS